MKQLAFYHRNISDSTFSITAREHISISETEFNHGQMSPSTKLVLSSRFLPEGKKNLRNESETATRDRPHSNGRRACAKCHSDHVAAMRAHAPFGGFANEAETRSADNVVWHFPHVAYHGGEHRRLLTLISPRSTIRFPI
jgi:hypothetical protein